MATVGKILPLNRRGAALIVAVLILVVLTIIGIYALTTSTVETKIAGFSREYEVAFYIADSGSPIAIEVTKYIIHHVPTTADDLPSPWDAVTDSSLIDEVFSETTSTDDVSSGPDIATNDQVNLGFPSDTSLKMDVDRLASYQIAGGAIEFGAGYEGIGRGQEAGGTAILFGFDSLGEYTTGAASRVETGYRHVVGVPGG